MARVDYEAIRQCTSELQGMLDVELFLGASISLKLVSLNEGQRTIEALKTSRMAAVLCILQLLKKKHECLDLFLSALRKSVEGHLDRQHSHFQLITVLVRKKEELQKQYAVNPDDSAVEPSSDQVSDSASVAGSVCTEISSDSNPPVSFRQYTALVTKGRSLPRSQSESQGIRHRSSQTLPPMIIHPSPASLNQPPLGWGADGRSPASTASKSTSSSTVTTQEQPYETLLFKQLRKTEVKMDQFMQRIEQWQANIETRMSVYDQFFKKMDLDRQKEGLREKHQAPPTVENAEPQKESQSPTLDVDDVELQEITEEEGGGGGLLPVDHHRVKLSKEDRNEGWFASYPRPTEKKGRSLPKRPGSWLGGGPNHSDSVRHESD